MDRTFFLIAVYVYQSLQEKAANAMILASDTVRWVMGPTGTIVTFPNEMGLPTIFDSKPRRYVYITCKLSYHFSDLTFMNLYSHLISEKFLASKI